MEAFAPIDTIVPMFMDAGKASNDHLGAVASGFFQVVAWAAIFWAALRITVGADSLEGSAVHLAGWFLRIFVLGTIAAMLLPTILPALIEGAFGIGTGMSGGKLTAADFLAPSKLFKSVWREVEILMKHAMSRWNPVTIFYYLICSLAILAAGIVMIGMVILSYIYFIMEAVGVVLTVMFGGSEKTAWMGRGGPAALVNRFMQMVMMSGVLSIGLVALEIVRLTGDPTITQGVIAAIVAILIAVGVLKSEQIGAAVVGGMPGPTSSGTAGAAFMGAASLLGAGAGAAANIVGSALPKGGSNGPAAPPPRDPQGSPSGPQGGSGGSGHAANPFGPDAKTSAASQAGASPPPAPSASQVAKQISDQARQLPKGTGEGAEAPTPQQWQDATLMGTDITGMTRSQAGAALDNHQNWYMARGTGTDAAPPSSHAGRSGAPQGVGAPSDWMQPSGGSASSPVVYPPAGPKFGLGGNLSSANPAERPLMRSAAGATVRRTFSPKSGGAGHQVALNSFQNDGRFQIGNEQLAYVGQGGGEGGTGYRRPGWQSPSVRGTAIPALSGQSYWQRREVAQMKQVHMGVTSRPPRAPKSAAATL